MKKKLYEYLRNRPQGSDSVDVVRDILRMGGASSQLADTLVTAIVDQDPRFLRDRQGLWHIEPAAQELLLSARFMVCAIEGNAMNQSGERRLYFQLCEGVRLKESGHLVIAQNRTQDAALIWSEQSCDHSLLHFLALLDESCVVVFKGREIYTIFNQLNRHYRGDELDCEQIEVKRLARALFKKSFRTIAEVANILNIRILDYLSPPAPASQLAEVSCAFFERCQERGVLTIDQLLELQEGTPRYVDFSKYAFDRDFLQSLPAVPGVYRMISRLGEVLYVGKARNLKRRLRCYFQKSEGQDAKMDLLRRNMHTLEYQVAGSELEALIMEHALIKEFDPPVNRQVDVHGRQVRSRMRVNCAIFLPSVAEPAVEIFFVSRKGHFAQYRCFAGIAPGERIRAFIDELYFAKKSDEPKEEDVARAEIVFSWLDRYRDFIHYLQIDSAADADDCYRLLTLHLQNFKNTPRQIFI